MCCTTGPAADAENFVLIRNFLMFFFEILIITWLYTLEQQVSINHLRQMTAPDICQ